MVLPRHEGRAEPVSRSGRPDNQRAGEPSGDKEFRQGNHPRPFVQGAGLPATHDAHRAHHEQRRLGLRVRTVLEFQRRATSPRKCFRILHIDIHHIFPVRWCSKDSDPPVPKSLYDSIINKTPIDAITNRIIGGKAPSEYLPILEKGNDLIADILKSHWLDQEILEQDHFTESFAERGEAMLKLIGEAMGKPIAGGRQTFWEALRAAGLAEVPQTIQSVETEELIEAVDDEQDYDALGDAAYEEVLATDDD